MIISVVGLFHADLVEAKSCFLKLSVKSVIEGVVTATVSEIERTVERMELNVSRRTLALKNFSS